MRFVRIKTHSEICYALPGEDGYVLFEGNPYEENFCLTDKKVPSSEAELLAPSEPSKIVAVGKNYRDHALELDGEIPKNMILFLKPSTSVLAPGKPIVYPKGVSQLDYEGELAFVIRKRAKNVRAEEARDYILGYTILNDVTARDVQREDVQWSRAKSYDTFCPFGPLVTDEVDPAALAIETRLNGEEKQKSNTKNFTWGVEEMLAFISSVMTLLPGDVVTTGTPAGIGPMQVGDVVEVEIEGIGVLQNSVVAP